MDKKLLALFRKLLALDNKALPDTISPEDFGKLIENSDGKLFIKPEDFKNLQKTLSLKDVDLNKAQELLKKATEKNDGKKSEADKAMDKMSKTISDLSETIKSMESTQESERLAKEYPDILPELLAGKNPDEITKIVDKQREVTKKLYGDSQRFAPPDFSSEADVDKAIEDVKSDDSISPEQAGVKVLKLGRQKVGLSNENENA